MPEGVPFIDELPDLSHRLSGVRILYTDLDGTLLGRGGCFLADEDGDPSLDAASAVVELNRAGLAVVIVSGRNSRQLLEISRMLGWRDFMAELGTIRVYDRGARKVVDTGEWPEGATHEGETPFEAIIRLGAIERLQQAFPRRIEHHSPWHLDREVTHVLRGNVDVPAAQAALDGLPLPILLIDNGIIHPPRHTLEGVEEVHAYHLVPAGVSKQRAIAADLEERGIAREQAIAVGDSAADVDMSQAVGLIVTVRNGLDDPALVSRAQGRENVAATRAGHGLGWKQLAEAWLEASR